MKTLFTITLLGMLVFGQAQVTDVPAVHVPAKSETVIESGINLSFTCSNGGRPTSNISGSIFQGDHDLHCVGGWRWGCAEKSAILLTAEDGTRHCLKIVPAEEPAKKPVAQPVKKPEKFTTGQLTDWEKKNCYVDTIGTPPPGGNGDVEIMGMSCPPKSDK